MQPISPINEASPSSETDDSEQECLLPQGTYQSFRFRFPSHLVRPEVVVNFSVFITEEDPGSNNSGSPTRAHGSEIFVGDMAGLVYRTRRVVEEMPAPNAMVPPAVPREDSRQRSLHPGNYAIAQSEYGSGVPEAQAQPDPGDGMVIWIDSPSQGDAVQTDSTSQHA